MLFVKKSFTFSDLCVLIALHITSYDFPFFQQFFIKLETTSFWANFGPLFCLKTDQFYVIYFTATSSKKSEKLWTLIFYKIWKTSFWVHFGLLWPKNLTTISSQKMSFLSVISLHATATTHQKQKKIHALISDKTWKSHSGSILAKNP